MKNRELASAFPVLKTLRERAAAARRAATKAATEAEALERTVREVSTVTEVREGVALRVERSPDGGMWLEAPGSDTRRCAEIYRNAQTGTSFGCHTYTDVTGRAGERWHGADLTREAAETIAFAWVLTGRRPAR